MILVHGQDSIIVVIGLAGHSEVKAFVTHVFFQVFISKGIFPMGAADIADLDIVIIGIHVVEFISIAVRRFHNLLITAVQKEKY